MEDDQARDPKPSRWWGPCTLYGFTDLHKSNDWIDPQLITAYAGQIERCPTTGREHLQFIVRFAKPRTWDWVKRILAPASIRRTVSPDDGWKYCQKEDTRVEGPWIFGKPDRRTRAEERAILTSAAYAGRHVTEVADELDVSIFTIPTLARALTLSIRPFYGQPRIVYLYGPPGAGKTTYVFERHPHQTVYKYVCGDSNCHALTPYAGQRVLLLDEFDKWPSYPGPYLLSLLDVGEKGLRWVGGAAPSSGETIYIAGNHAPWDLELMTRETKLGFLRRVATHGEVIRIDADHSVHPVPLSQTSPWGPAETSDAPYATGGGASGSSPGLLHIG